MAQGRPLSWYRRLSDRRGRLRFELVGELAAALRTIETLQVRDISWKARWWNQPCRCRSNRCRRCDSPRAIYPAKSRRECGTSPESDGADGSEWYRIGLEFLDLQPAMREELGRLSGNGLEHSAES